MKNMNRTMLPCVKTVCAQKTILKDNHYCGGSLGKSFLDLRPADNRNYQRPLGTILLFLSAAHGCPPMTLLAPAA